MPAHFMRACRALSRRKFAVTGLHLDTALGLTYLFGPCVVVLYNFLRRFMDQDTREASIAHEVVLRRIV